MPERPPATAELAHELRETLGRLVRRLRAEPGPPVARLTILGRLDREGAATVGELAAAERMRQQSMTQAVRELEADGLVSRRPDPEDGRRAFVSLTADGRALLQATRAERESWLTAALDEELDADERALLREAIALLGRVAEHR